MAAGVSDTFGDNRQGTGLAAVVAGFTKRGQNPGAGAGAAAHIRAARRRVTGTSTPRPPQPRRTVPAGLSPIRVDPPSAPSAQPSAQVSVVSTERRKESGARPSRRS